MNAVTFIGFGEAGMAFARPGAAAYDRLTDDAASRDAKRADYAAAGVLGCDRASDALDQAQAILCLVTADQALSAARACARHLREGALWLDMNSAAPGTKREAASIIEGAGGRYVDVAVMAPVYPKRLGTPLLVSGPHAEAGVAALHAHGFTAVRTVGTRIGDASSIKMIRSVMIKGVEALTAECALAAHAAGVEAEVIASLDTSWPGADWSKRFDYNLDRMLVHGVRRSEEMYEVTQTLLGLGFSPVMSEAALGWQRALGELAINPPEGLPAKIEVIRSRLRAFAA
ncbi:NAD(P)-dependent oxidoreductase [Sphingomonas sp.]|jgi:3-hydroxyisobutyrate dehydrogenase-like beta-hydroxyacid dehydrogenase|uniref:NAD(P)-dependent oxidoreductase n=1 Tax=Sphingomonas sp. TaxID=28214 RepID=UPI002EDA85FB